MKRPRIYIALCNLLDAAADDYRASAAKQRQPDTPEDRETGADSRVESAPNPEPDELHAQHYRGGPPLSRPAGFTTSLMVQEAAQNAINRIEQARTTGIRSTGGHRKRSAQTQRFTE